MTSRNARASRVVPSQARRHVTPPDPHVDIVDEAALLRLAALKLLRHRVDPGLVALYAVRVTTIDPRPGAVDAVAEASERRLRSVLRPADVVGRLGDGSLAVLADGLLSAPAVFALDDRLLTALGAPVDIPDEAAAVPIVSIGLALTGNPMRKATDMLRHAMLSMEVAVQAGGNCIERADPEFVGLLDLTGAAVTEKGSVGRGS